MNNFFRTFLLLFLLLGLCAPNVWARLAGEVDWGYAHYEQSSDGGDEASATHFTQRYSLMYSTDGLLGGGRLGYYDLGIGAEWGAYNTDYFGKTLSNDNYKYLYKGVLHIAPGALPFRLHAYSHDKQKIQHSALGVFATELSSVSYASSLFNPGIVTTLRNGQTISSGIQFIAGIRNGSYLGEYRELLSRWPRLLVDYRDVYRIDERSARPTKYRDSDLAFVSLNKKDNWFHYRSSKHVDYLDQQNNSLETTILLGTVDHTLKRQWINLTNWIRISVDGSYTVTENSWDPDKSKQYNVNFFTTMQRRDFTAGSFLGLHRRHKANRINNILDLPAYLNKRLNAETEVLSSFRLYRNRETFGNFGEENKEAYHAKALLKTRQLQRVKINPSLEMEIDTGSQKKSQAVRTELEAYSTILRRNRFSWYGKGSLATFNNTDETNPKRTLWEGQLRGRLDYSLRNNRRVGVGQDLLYGQGDLGSASTLIMSAMTDSGFINNSFERSSNDVSLFRGTTTLFYEQTSAARVSNRFQLDYKFQRKDDERLDSVKLFHKLNYGARLWRVVIDNAVTWGDDSNSVAQQSGSLAQGSTANSSEGRFLNRSRVDFSPSNYWRSSLDIVASATLNGQDMAYSVKQQVQRSFFASRYVKRRRGDISQSLVYEQFANDNRSITFSLSGNYFPTTYWQMGARLYYNHYNYQPNTLFYTLTTGLDFPLFKVDLDYKYGASDSGVVAHRYEVNVKKTF